jgi:tetratricopeptide (TPR) repeat protein
MGDEGSLENINLPDSLGPLETAEADSAIPPVFGASSNESAPRFAEMNSLEMPGLGDIPDNQSMDESLNMPSDAPPKQKSIREQVEEHCSRAFEFMREGNYDKSINEYQLALQLESDYLPAMNNLAIVYEKKPSWHKQAIEQWEKVLELSKKVEATKHIERAQKHLSNLRKML